MSLYTKTGDNGETSLFGGKRVLKSDKIIEAIGSIDELNSFLGLAVVKLKNKKDKDFFISIQKDLYQIMAVLSGGKNEDKFLENKVVDFENKIDEIEKKLPPLNKFIIPGDTEIAAIIHIVRSICRRAERRVVKLKKFPLIIKYLNRLSDLLFAFSRLFSKKDSLY